MTDAKTQLEEVNAAISAILMGGQSYKIGSRTLTRADLATLYKMKNELESAVSEAEAPGLGRKTALAFFDRR
ncbi:MAG TPA: peptidylprolyl isomerase [Candidatus Ornithomonoglobus merdipullorum]|uniref:Peptidylprolyl isomerase n=1 Tax=Candidatus Ornithomonoglobus merdipullorum TaxID=2840895 RepID=A0A9D1M9S5_9FIRM|nr:peptidylprolyl isomerase [Candidatus Ornithomonoglobus merdipullorum]